MQEITVPKQPSIADQVVALPIHSVVVGVRRVDRENGYAAPGRPWVFIHRVGVDGWLTTRHAARLDGVSDFHGEGMIRAQIDAWVFNEVSFFVLYDPSNEGWQS